MTKILQLSVVSTHFTIFRIYYFFIVFFLHFFHFFLFVVCDCDGSFTPVSWLAYQHGKRVSGRRHTCDAVGSHVTNCVTCHVTPTNKNFIIQQSMALQTLYEYSTQRIPSGIQSKGGHTHTHTHTHNYVMKREKKERGKRMSCLQNNPTLHQENASGKCISKVNCMAVNYLSVLSATLYYLS